MQDLDQGSVYVSSRLGPLDIETMAVPHAERALDALRREYGPLADASPLGRALLRRTALRDARADARVSPFGDPAGVALRGTDGRIRGYARPSLYRKREPEPDISPAAIERLLDDALERCHERYGG